MKTAYEQNPSLCPECGSRKIIQDGGAGETVCNGCGLVLADPAIALGPEWRAYSLKEESNKARGGLPKSFAYHDQGLSTVIGPIDWDAMGNKIKQDTKHKMYRVNYLPTSREASCFTG